MDSAATPARILHLRSQQLALGLIVGFSALPVELRSPAWVDLDWGVAPLDAMWNVFFYVPLGIALRRYGVLRCGLVATGVSLAIESLQVFYVGRYPSISDVATNLAGALVGFALAGKLGPFATVRLGRRAGALTLLLALLCIAYLSLPGHPTHLSNWDPGFNLSVGSDPDGSASWQGEFLELAVFSPALDGARIAQLADDGPGSIRSFREQLPEQSLFELYPTDNLDQFRGQPLLESNERGEFFDTLVRQGSLSVATWLRIGALDQSGLASIVTYSANRRARNLLLGQYLEHFVFQLRTTGTGADARSSKMTATRGPLEVGRDVFVAASYDGHVSRIHVDGRLAARTNLSSTTKPIPFLADSGLPAVSALVGALMATGALALWNPAPGRRNWIGGTVAGLIGAALLVLCGGTSSLPGFTTWALVLGGAGGLFVVSAIVRAEPVAAPGAETNAVPSST